MPKTSGILPAMVIVSVIAVGVLFQNCQKATFKEGEVINVSSNNTNNNPTDDNDQETVDQTPRHLKAFVTASVYDGNLGGVSGANAKCQNEAETFGHSGKWIALINTTEVKFQSLIPSYALSYTHAFVESSGPRILWDSTFSGKPLENLPTGGFRTDIVGNLVVDVWLGSFNSTSPANCNNWTASDQPDQGLFGNCSRTDFLKTEYPIYKFFCGTHMRLVCIEI